jgi:hypothetical protein
MSSALRQVFTAWSYPQFDRFRWAELRLLPPLAARSRGRGCRSFRALLCCPLGRKMLCFRQYRHIFWAGHCRPHRPCLPLSIVGHAGRTRYLPWRTTLHSGCPAADGEVRFRHKGRKLYPSYASHALGARLCFASGVGSLDRGASAPCGSAWSNSWRG